MSDELNLPPVADDAAPTDDETAASPSPEVIA